MVSCVPTFRGGSRTVYTALFFWDEASAFAAGHRPCRECRYNDYQRYLAFWRAAGLPGDRAAEMDHHLHGARVRRDRSQVRHLAGLEALPPGTFVLWQQKPVVIGKDAALQWSPAGYAEVILPKSGAVEVLTPEPVVEVFRAGYQPAIAFGGG
ncbi:MAG: hypothetical protein AAF503_09855 [Pseudomonadota bacterium]